MNQPCANSVFCPIYIDQEFDSATIQAWFDGIMNGRFIGIMNGTFIGEIDGCVDVVFSGVINVTADACFYGTFTGTINGSAHDGPLNECVVGTLNGTFNGRIVGCITGYIAGSIVGQVDATFNGHFTGYLDGIFTGHLTGLISGTINGIPTDTDIPYNNTSSEAPDTGGGFPDIFFPPSGPQPPGFPMQDPNLPGGGGGGNPPIILFQSTEQTCSEECDSETVSYTAVAGLFSAITQTLADQLAFAFACQYVDIVCDTGDEPTVYQSTAQTCSNSCGSSYTAPAGLFSAFTQEEADALANSFACQLALLTCPPTSPGTVTPPGSLEPGEEGGPGPDIPPSVPFGPTPIYYKNTAQTCDIACPEGGTFSHTVAADLYVGPTPAIANAVAYSYACKEALEQRFCISGSDTHACVGTSSDQTLTVSGSTPVNWTAEELPDGLTITGNGLTAEISGTPTNSGNFPVAVTATDPASGNSITRVIVYTVSELTGTLPEAEIGVEYEGQITPVNMTAPYDFQVASGALPVGLTLNNSSGEITGIPEGAEEADFTIVCIDSAGFTCQKEFSITVAGSVGFGFFSGGRTNVDESAVSEKLEFATDTLSVVAAAALSVARAALAGTSSSEKSFFAGGNEGVTSYTLADRIDFSTETSAAIPGASLSEERWGLAGLRGNTFGFFSGGYDAGLGGARDTSDRVTYATEVTVNIPSANLPSERMNNVGIGNSVKGFSVAGQDSTSARTATAYKIDYTTEISSDVPGASISVTAEACGGASGSSSKAFICGGFSLPGFPNIADKIEFATETSAAVPGAQLSVWKYEVAGTGSSTSNYFGGGTISGNRSATVDKINLTTETSSLIADTLTSGTSYLAGS